MRLLSRILDNCLAICHGCSHHNIDCGTYRNLIHIYVCALKLLCPGDDKAMSYVYLCSH